jgi:hypothetical protein
MTGPIPAGDYHITVAGYQSSHDAKLRADVLFRPQGGNDQMISSASNAAAGADIDAVVAGAAAPGGNGDLLVLRVRMLSGTSDYIELGTGLTIP